MKQINYIKIFFALVGLAYFLYYASSSLNWHFIDNFNLLIHEAGHVIFSFFGQFMYVLGGSLVQILLPSIFVFYFWRRRDYFSAALVGFWVGQNLINVSVYAGDAVKMELPLLGGDSSGHDWHWLLSQTNLLAHTDTVAAVIYFVGLIIILVSGILAIKFALNDPITDNTEVEN